MVTATHQKCFDGWPDELWPVRSTLRADPQPAAPGDGAYLVLPLGASLVPANPEEKIPDEPCT